MVVLVGIAQWDKNRTHWPETHQAPIGPEESGGLKGSMQHWPVVYSPEFQNPTTNGALGN